MLAIQKFLKAKGHDALSKAIERFKIDIYNEDPELIVLNYHMIESPRGIQEVEECRGLVLERKTWNVVAYPFYRFYNQHEKPYAAKVNMENSVLFEKRDGTLCTLYYYDGWKVATRSRPMAEGQVNDSKETFASLFWRTLEGNYGNHWERMEYRNLNFVFELTGPQNRVLTPYHKNDVRLLSIRHIDNYAHKYEEFPLPKLQEVARKIKIPMVKIYDFKDLKSIQGRVMDSLESLDEGFVLVDYTKKKNGSYHRIKIKNPQYLKAHRLIGSGFNSYKAMELVLGGDTGEFLGYFSDYRPLVEKVEKILQGYCEEVDSDFKRLYVGYNDTDEWRKQFAIAAHTTKNPSIMFALLKDPKRKAIDVIRNDFKKSQKKRLAEELFG